MYVKFLKLQICIGKSVDTFMITIYHQITALSTEKNNIGKDKLKSKEKLILALCLVFLILFFIHRAVCGASTVILSFLIHTESVPCGGTENLFLRHVVHANGNAKDRAKCDYISTYMAV